MQISKDELDCKCTILYPVMIIISLVARSYIFLRLFKLNRTLTQVLLLMEATQTGTDTASRSARNQARVLHCMWRSGATF